MSGQNVTVYENDKFILNLSLNNDTEIIEDKIKNFSRKTIGCHKDSSSTFNYILSARAVDIGTVWNWPRVRAIDT